MNRRELFKFASAAAVALPAIVKTATETTFASGALIQGAPVDLGLTAESDAFGGFLVPRGFAEEIWRKVSAGGVIAHWEAEAEASSIVDLMTEDDLF